MQRWPSRHYSKDPPIIVAARQGEMENVMRAIEQDPSSIEQEDQWGNTPLNWACCEGHADLTRALLRQGANRKKQNAGGYLAMHWACIKSNREQDKCVEALLTIPPDDLDLADELARAVNETHRLEGGQSKPTLYMPTGSVNPQSGWVPLHHAASNGNIKAVRVLLEHGAEVDARNFGGFTPLHWAAAEGHLDCVQLLLEHGADIEAVTKDGWPPLHMAARWDRVELVKFLLEEGADPNARTKDGRSAPMIAKPKCQHLFEVHP